MRYRRNVTADDIKTTGREERGAAMTEALLSEGRDLRPGHR